MWDTTFWTKKLKEAERELEAATRLADLNEAAKKVHEGEGSAESGCKPKSRWPDRRQEQDMRGTLDHLE
jgi:hypothetical protein